MASASDMQDDDETTGQGGAADTGEDQGEQSPGAGEDQGGDLSQGYCIELCVMPDGSYRVDGPEPLQDETEEGESPADMQSYDSIGEALKEVLRLAKENPIGDANAQFDAGFASK